MIDGSPTPLPDDVGNSDLPAPMHVVVAAPATTSTMATNRSRLKWEPITVIHEDGTVANPFLAKRDNWMDIMLLRALIVKQPFDASYRKQGVAWKTCASTLSAAEDPQDNLVYGVHGVGDKAIKKRFEDLMAYAKKSQSEVPFCSGCDNDDAPNELQTLLDDLNEIYSAKLEDGKLASTTAAAKKADDFAKAEALRNALLGMLSPKDKELIGMSRSSSSSDISSHKKAKRQNQLSDVASLIEIRLLLRISYRRALYHWVPIDICQGEEKMQQSI
jgi:hypothetical protein